MGAIADQSHTWPVVGTRDIHRDGWVVALREDMVQRPGHPDESFARLVVEHPGAVVVLAIDDDERVCCIRQYRHAGRAVFIELPAGICDTAAVTCGSSPAVSQMPAGRTHRSPRRASSRKRWSCEQSTGGAC